MAMPYLFDPAAALDFKEKGNDSFKRGDFIGAEAYYTKAIAYDKANHILFTNRAMALLKLSSWVAVITDAQTSIRLLPHNMKGYYYLSQAQIALSRTADALQSAKEAHRICVEDGPKGQGSLGPITELVLRCKKMDWERRERERVRERGGLLRELEDLLEKEGERDLRDVVGTEKLEREWEYQRKLELLRSTFELARINEDENRRRRAPPEWIIDGISFDVMVDPLVTKTGKSYDRTSIMEHLKRNPVDPVTREPMTIADLRPNLALKEACDEYLAENGWAVDY